MKEVVLAYSAFHDTLDFEDFLSKIKSGFNESVIRQSRLYIQLCLTVET